MMLLKNMVRGLEQDAPAKQLIQCWDHDADTLKYWRASSNFVYTFEREGQRQFLRFIHAEDNTPENIQAELDFVLYLLDQGYPAAAPVRSIDGNWIETIQSERGPYYGVVFEQASGTYVPMDQMSEAHLESWGRSLASLHQLSEAYRPENTSRGSWTDAIAWIASVLDRYPQETALRQQLGQVTEQLAALPVGSGYTGLIHYDFETDNIFYQEEEGRYCAIDFDDAMVHWFMMDVASAAADLLEQEGANAERSMQLFLDGYRSVKELDERCLRALPVFQRFEDLYRFARLLRSLEGFEELPAPPEWAVRLKHKLLGICHRIRERYSVQAVTLQPVDAGNWLACTHLEVANEQRSLFPVPAVYWLAESAYCGFTPLALYEGEQLAGLTVYAVDPDDGSYWVMAYMIDHKFQGRGLGKAGMVELIRYIRARSGCDKLKLGHRPDNERAARLYAALGFEEISLQHGEVIRELRFLGDSL
ncbi:GNAT family N-acetyltransferase [Paenibacillus filicis]|uniref:Bifunctional AAC/APH n=1 Tax=Paenibacillus filicis TaxID=669464 RepID=A0ABU9DPG1_9BACL